MRASQRVCVSLTHTASTRLIEAGAKPVDVAARLGHADTIITQNLYTHDTADMQRETARIFGGIVVCRQTVDNMRKSVVHPFYIKGLLKYGAF